VSRPDAILSAVQCIHEAVLTPAAWSGAMSAIADVTASQKAFILAVDPATGTTTFVSAAGATPDHLAAIAAAPASRRLPRWVADIGAGCVTPVSAIEPDRAFVRSMFYNECVRPAGDFYGILAAPLRTPSCHLYLTASRRHGHADYTDEDSAALARLMPHVTRAMRVNDRLARADLCAAAADAALDRLDAGVILVDVAGQVLFANPVADAILSRGTGLCRGHEGLGVTDPLAARALRRLIVACARQPGGDDGRLEIPRGQGRQPLRLLVSRFPAARDRIALSWLGTVQPAAIVVVCDPDAAQQRRADALRARFGLTASEVDVALEIVKGDGRQGTADRLGITLATASTHLQHVFSKTGVSRQAELVRLVLDSHHDIEV